MLVSRYVFTGNKYNVILWQTFEQRIKSPLKKNVPTQLMVNKRPGVNSSICCNCGQEVLLTQPRVLLRLTWSLFLVKSRRSVMLKQGLRQAIINLSKDWTKNKGKNLVVGKIPVFNQLFTYFNKPVTETKDHFVQEQISLLLTQSGRFESIYGYYEVSLT